VPLSVAAPELATRGRPRLCHGDENVHLGSRAAPCRTGRFCHRAYSHLGATWYDEVPWTTIRT
jgi:hypothetical protein